MIANNIKKKLHSFLIENLNNKIEILKQDIAETIEARNNDTKSSAGDKFETGREMMNVEIQKAEKLLATTAKLVEELKLINLQNTNKKVVYGSVVFTNNGNYFISIAYGKTNIDEGVFYAISLASPIGKLLHNKQEGDVFSFQGKEFVIENIL